MGIQQHSTSFHHSEKVFNKSSDAREDFKDVPPDQEVEIEEPLSSKRVAPRPKKERADDWKEMVDYALIDTELGNFVLWKLKAPSVES